MHMTQCYQDCRAYMVYTGQVLSAALVSAASAHPARPPAPPRPPCPSAAPVVVGQ